MSSERHRMALALARMASVTLAALVAGGMFIIWAGYNPAALSASAYVEQQQNAIRGLNVLMPVLGGLAILATLSAAFMQRRDRRTCVLLIVAAAFLIMSGLITRFGNQPINAIVMTWNVGTPPANWLDLRDQWWGFHRLRTISGLIALVLVVWESIRPGATAT